MVEVDTPDAVIDVLKTAGSRCVGIDGINGSGKSTLAKAIAAKFNCRVFCLDDYLEREKGGFLEFIDYNRLKADVSNEKSYVIEGVCLLEALDRAYLRIDALVYVKRRHLGLWADERDLDLNESLEDFLEGERRLTAMVTDGREEGLNLGLYEAIIRYHYKIRPQNSAHVVYFRDEQA
ncbi:MAG: hypothetical protein EHM16_08045 [Betaproteobacteria bacterium]|nr:MAG: hypothetical protein EHM16_08045 [Betaproteobacteria bacterium]